MWLRDDVYLPHHCGSLEEPVVCAIFLPPGVLSFLVTKFLSRGILRKYLWGSPSFKSTFWGTPWLLYNWWTMLISPNHLPNTLRPQPFAGAISCAQNIFQNYHPSQVPSGLPLDYIITGGQCPSLQAPSRYPLPPTLLKYHIMCPKFS